MSIERIANRQLMNILFVKRTTIVLSTLSVLTSADALQDGWLSVPISLGAAVVILILFITFSRRFPRETMLQYSCRLLGPWLGRLVVLPYLWLFLHLAAIEARLYAEVLISGFLTETPILFITAVMVFAAALAAFMGLEVIGRVADIIFPLFFFMVLVTFILPLPEVDLSNLQPVLARGWGPVWRGALTSTGLIAQYTVLGFILPSLERPRRAMPWVLAAVTASFAVLFLAAVIVPAVLGPQEAARSTFPVLRMVRAVRVTQFLERMEALIIFAWGLGLFVSLAVYLFAGARGLAQFFGVGNYRPLVPPMAVIWAGLSIHNVSDIFQLQDLLEYRLFGPYTLSLILAPLLLWWAVWLLRRLVAFVKRRLAEN